MTSTHYLCLPPLSIAAAVALMMMMDLLLKEGRRRGLGRWTLFPSLPPTASRRTLSSRMAAMLLLCSCNMRTRRVSSSSSVR